MDAALRAGPQHFLKKVRKNPNLYMLGFLQCWPTALFEKSAQKPTYINWGFCALFSKSAIY
jgi:hypothetical protein